MTLEDAKKYADALAKKSAECDKSEDAIRFSQAANNVANTACALQAAGKKD